MKSNSYSMSQSETIEVLREFNKSFMPLSEEDKTFLSVKPKDEVIILTTASDEYPEDEQPITPISRRRTWLYAKKVNSAEVGFIPSTYLKIIYPDIIFGPNAMDLLDELLEEQRCCPLFLTECFEITRIFGEVADIFRASASLNDKNVLLEKINDSKDHDITQALTDYYATYEHKQLQPTSDIVEFCQQLKEPTIHVIANLLQEYFSDMPNKLIENHVIEFLLEYSDSTAEKNDQFARTIIKNLDYEQFLIFRYLIQFLNRMSKHGMQTRMYAEELGQLFCPNIMEDYEPDILIYFIKNEEQLEKLFSQKYPLPKYKDNFLSVQWRLKYVNENNENQATVISNFEVNDPEMLECETGDRIMALCVHQRWVRAAKDHEIGWIPIECVKFDTEE